MRTSDFRSIGNFLRRKMCTDILVEFDQERNTLVVSFTDVHGYQCRFEGCDSDQAEMSLEVRDDSRPAHLFLKRHLLTLGDNYGFLLPAGLVVEGKPLGKAGLKSCFELCYTMHTSWVGSRNSMQLADQE